MTKQAVGLGAAPNDGTGDNLRVGAGKINDNFNEVYNALGNGTALTTLINASGEIDVPIGVGTGKNKIVFYYDQFAELPSTATYHGAVAHVHATGALYYAHGNWNKLVSDVSDGPINGYTHPGPQLVYTTTSSTNSSAYFWTGPGIATGGNPNFTVYRGHTYIFDNRLNSGPHPLAIRVNAGGAAFTEGVSTPVAGVLKFVVPHEPSDTTLVYQCTVHSGMVGNITIV